MQVRVGNLRRTLALATTVGALMASAASGQVVMSQIWGGGGFLGNGPNADCVELFNAGNSPVSLAGYSLQFRSATSTAAFSAGLTFALNGTIPAKGYFLVRLENPQQTGFAITPDQSFTGVDPLSVNRGQLALVIGTAPLGAGCSPLLNGNTAIADFVGYGRGFNNDLGCPGAFCAACNQSASAVYTTNFLSNAPGGNSLSSAVWIRRKCGGLLLTGSNFDTWEQAGPGVNITSNFRNSASPTNAAGVSITPGPTSASAAPGGSIVFTALASADCGTVTGINLNLTPIGGGASVAMTAVNPGSFSLNVNVGPAVTPGVKSIVFTASSSGGQTSSSTLNISITPSNDECSGAITLSGASPFAWTNTGATTGATSQVFAGCDNGGSNSGLNQNDVWYRWTAPSSGEFTVSTIGSVGNVQPNNRYDARLAIYSDACPPAAPLACNDDSPGGQGPASATKFLATAGVSYLIQVGSDQINTTTAQGILNISVGAAGVCCSGDEICTVVIDQAACTNLGGFFQGTGSTCATVFPFGCPSPNGACCYFDTLSQQPACSITDRQFCLQVYSGVFRLGEACDPDPCSQPLTGRCCVGARCVTNVADAAACTALQNNGAGSAFTAGATNCNTAGSYSSPCCQADYNKSGTVSVQDIFDFLTGWFGNSLNADINASASVTVQDIFDFLSAWFAGNCV